MDAPHRCLHCHIHDEIQRWIESFGHPGAIELVRCLAVVTWDVKQAADWTEDGEPATIDGLQTHH